jgi:proline iminopeptidase
MKQNIIFLTMVIALGCMTVACKKGELDPNEPGNLVPLTVVEDSSIPAIEVNGTKLHAEAFGHPDSALLLVLHGGPGADYRYLLNCKAFADAGFRVVFYDQRGSGLSQRHSKDSYDLDVMVEDLDAVIEHYRTRPDQEVFFLGHSWGAILASQYINSYPERVSGAILCEPGGLTFDQIKDYLGRSQDYSVFSEALNDAVYLDQFLTGDVDDHEILDYKFGLWGAAEDSGDSPVGNEGLLPSWRSGAVVNLALFDLAEKQGYDVTANLAQYAKKILFIYSENNSAYGEAHAKNVSAPYPNVQLFLAEDAGHDMLSFPTGFQNCYPAILDFLNHQK